MHTTAAATRPRRKSAPSLRIQPSVFTRACRRKAGRRPIQLEEVHLGPHRAVQPLGIAVRQVAYAHRNWDESRRFRCGCSKRVAINMGTRWADRLVGRLVRLAARCSCPASPCFQSRTCSRSPAPPPPPATGRSLQSSPSLRQAAQRDRTHILTLPACPTSRNPHFSYGLRI